MHQYTPNLGEPAGDDARRDAVHVAVAPVVAGQRLHPGDRVAVHDDRRARRAVALGPPAVGIVDPFLRGDVEEGGRFWLLLFPGTVTG